MRVQLVAVCTVIALFLALPNIGSSEEGEAPEGEIERLKKEIKRL